MGPAPNIMDVDVAVVVGPMRSGTTLLARVLDSHPAVTYAFADTAGRLQRSLSLPPVDLEPPEPLDPSRLDAWRDLLGDSEQRVVADVLY